MPSDDPGPSETMPTRPSPEVARTPPQGREYSSPGWFPAGLPVAPEPAVPSEQPATRSEPTVLTAEQPAAPPRRRSRAPVVVLSAVLVLVLVGAGLLLARMVATTQAWQDSSTGWERLAHQNADALATTQSELATAQSELDTTTAQLATAQTRITDLANEKAQLGDTSAAQQQLADYQSRVSQAAGQVATALAACITGQQKLIGYLRDAQKYDAAQLAQFGQDVQTLCGQATDANAALQAELKR